MLGARLRSRAETVHSSAAVKPQQTTTKSHTDRN